MQDIPVSVLVISATTFPIMESAAIIGSLFDIGLASVLCADGQRSFFHLPRHP